MAVPELMGIANELGIKVKQDDSLETVVYAILDKAAENSATGDETPKKKRTRIQKKDTSRVYTVTGQDGENLDSIKKRKPVEAPSLFSDEPLTKKKAKAKEEASVATEKNPSEEAPAEEKPKRRGRKSKAELAAETEAADAAQKEAEAEIPATPEFEAPVESTPDFVPEEAYFSDNTEEAGEEQLQMMEQLKQKLERGMSITFLKKLRSAKKVSGMAILVMALTLSQCLTFLSKTKLQSPLSIFLTVP